MMCDPGGYTLQRHPACLWCATGRLTGLGAQLAGNFVNGAWTGDLGITIPKSLLLRADEAIQ